MMETIKYITVFVLVLMFGIGTHAQEKKLKEEQKELAKADLETYFELLDLNEEQKAKYEDIIKKYGDQLNLVQDSGAGKEDKIKALKNLQERKDDEMKVLLSEQQYELYLKQKLKRKQMLLENSSEEFAEYRQRLDLTEQQKPQFIEISQKYGQQFKELKNSSESRLSKYRAYKSIQKNKNKEMKTLLDSKQYKVYLEIQKEVQKKIKEKRGQ